MPLYLQIIDLFYQQHPQLKVLLLDHSTAVKNKALQLLDDSKLDLDRELIISGAMLHDIGIIRCHAPEILCPGTGDYIAHGIEGAKMLYQCAERFGFDPAPLARICERHTGSGLTREDIIRQALPLPQMDLLPETMEEKLICLADKYFSKSGSMQEKPLEKVRSSMAKFGTDSLRRFDDLYSLFVRQEKSVPAAE